MASKSVDCSNPGALGGADQLFCLVQDPFKAAVSYQTAVDANKSLTILLVV